jgi:hypothetical protein
MNLLSYTQLPRVKHSYLMSEPNTLSQTKAPVIISERHQEGIHAHCGLEVVNDAFSVQKIVGREEKVPVVRLLALALSIWLLDNHSFVNQTSTFSFHPTPTHATPRLQDLPMDRSKPRQLFLPTRYHPNRDDFSVNQRLNKTHEQNNCDWAWS